MIFNLIKELIPGEQLKIHMARALKLVIIKEKSIVILSKFIFGNKGNKGNNCIFDISNFIFW